MEIRLLDERDADLLINVPSGVFDEDVDPALARAFLADPRHHIAAAVVDGAIVGFASGVHYIHPDKPAQLWINEVGVASGHEGKGIGKALMQCLVAHGQSLGCSEAWVLTHRENARAMRLYSAVPGSRDPEDCVLMAFGESR